MSEGTEAVGELVFRDLRSLESFLARATGREVDLGGWIGSGAPLDLGSVRLVEGEIDGAGRIHVRFEGDELWASAVGTEGENYLDVLRRESVAGCWESRVFNSLDVWGDESDLIFFSPEYLEERRRELLEGWKRDLDGLFGALG